MAFFNRIENKISKIKHRRCAEKVASGEWKANLWN